MLANNHKWYQYGAAVASIVLATIARMLLDPILGDHLPFVTYFVAVMFTAWYGGLGPSLLALALGAVAAAQFFIPPKDSLAVHGAANWLGLGLYFFVGIVATFLSESMRAAQRRAEEQREWLRVTLSSIGDAVIAADDLGRVAFLNGVAESLTGWTREEAAGKPLESMFRIINEATRLPVENPVGKVIREGQVVGLANHTVLIARDGTERPIEDSAAPIRNDAGNIKGIVLVFHDVTEKKRTEEEREQLLRTLGENDRRKDEFLAMLAHELRNPLAAINNAVHFIARSETEEDLEWAKEVVDRQVRHLARLIDDLLDISRITRGKIGLRKEPLDLSPVVSGAVEAVRPLIEERKHQLTVSLAPGAMRLEADPVRLEEILVNLLTNAAKFTEDGGRIWLTADHEGREIVIKVRDTGVGIPAEQLPQMFELFAQGDRSIARTEGGLGIGLTLVQKLAEMHGGSVTAFSEGLGKGSEFTVRLPALETLLVEKSKSKAPLPHVARQGSRVLVVDDNVDTVRGLVKLLRLLGHDIQTAHDGPTAIEVARSHRPEIVLLDIGLPGMDGYQVAQRLREEDCCDQALLIAITGYGQEDDRRRSREAGFDHHLVKPVDYNTLVSLMGQPC